MAQPMTEPESLQRQEQASAGTRVHLSYVQFHKSVEIPQPDEQNIFEELAATMRHITASVNDQSRHAYRAVHAKSHGLLKGELRIVEGLPPELKQGLFATAKNYPAIIRFSTNPGDILPDTISTPRGMAVKILGVDGPMVSEHGGHATQDILMLNAKAFPNPRDFLKGLKLVVQHLNDSEALKQFVSTAARAAESVLETIGQESATLKGFGHPETHPLGETYCTVVPLRYGDHIAKMCLAPSSANLQSLRNKALHFHGAHSGLRDAIVDFFKTERAVWDVQVQLCTDLETMPVEDASVQWPEHVSPYRTVAQLVVEPQNAYSAARRVYVDEVLSFSPWHALEAHRPLGGIMRARRQAYDLCTRFRHEMNGREVKEPTSISELPD